MSTTVAPLSAAVLVPTRLSERIARHGDTERAFVAARRRFLSGGRVEMGPLAAELGVDRTSLFRWVGNRDDLLTEVLWSLAAPTLEQAEAGSAGSGAERIGSVLTAFVTALLGSRPFRDFVARDPARALRILTGPDSVVHRRFVAVTERLIDEEVRAGRMLSPLSARDLAYLLVRVTESFASADLVAGAEPDPSTARTAIDLVLASMRT